MANRRILILGVTGSGKGRLAFELAEAIGAEIISIDSMKVYRRMDIGTAKPPLDARRRVKYHLIDVVEPSESFSVGLFVDSVQPAIEQIEGVGKPVIAVGGTALYIKALLYGLFEGPGQDERVRNDLQARALEDGLEQLYLELEKVDPVAAEHIHANDARRIIRALEVYKITGKPISSMQQQWDGEPEHGWTIIGLRREKTDDSSRINRRAKEMIDKGLVEEVRSLLTEERPLSKQARSAIGYAEIIAHLEGQMGLDDAIELIKKNTRRLAKSQRTWFKTFKDVHWLDIEAEAPAEEIFDRALILLEHIE
ncbi:MAG TPA: tRNA (adenosine(37)-N6)-dimethylallyltransferase MiaA [Sedimentisphaerales bacterium]|nr:tRNA (adenosine(37)-N6)-dimethylallyltransferase MiaA [Sedimentisphaerales bacterium]